MLAVNISSRLHEPVDDLPTPPLDELPEPEAVLAVAGGPWRIAASVVKTYADWLLAAADEVIVGIYRITAAHRDTNDPQQVTFDLTPSNSWRWAVGQHNPFNFRGKDPVRRVAKGQLVYLRDLQPRHTDTTHGWTLDIADDGRSAIIHGPTPTVAITALHEGTVHLALDTAT